MEDTSSWEMVYIDDILCHEQDASEQGWPACAGVKYVDGQSHHLLSHKLIDF